MAVVAPPRENLVSADRLVRGRSSVPAIDAAALARALEREVEGDVRFDRASRGAYAHDASNYRRVPIGVVLPKSKADVIAAIDVCRRFGAPIVARGGGTSLGGQTVNDAVVLDFSKHMTRITAFDPERRRATVEPGVLCDALIAHVAPFELTWGPKPATHAQCCFGGMLANNSGGMHAQMNGVASENVDAIDCVLYDGTRMQLGWTTDAALEHAIRSGAPGARVLRALLELRNRYGERIRARYPKLRRRVSGYNLDELLPGDDGRFNLARVVVGSEGTLITMLEATVGLLDAPRRRATVILGYDDVFGAGDAVPEILELEPLSLEGMDDVLRNHIERKGGERAAHLDLFPHGHAFLLVEVGGRTDVEVREQAESVVRRATTAIDARIHLERDRQRAIWEVRESGLGSTAFVPGEPDAWPGFEDSAVPPAKLGAYLRELRALLDQYGYKPALYGHFGMGVVHCRIPFDLYTANGIAAFRRFMSDAADLVVSFGGSLSGEHGDGQARGELLEKMFGAELVGAMRELKAIFDPAWKMNPGKIVHPYPIVDALKMVPAERAPAASEKTHFGFVRDGGSITRAAQRCVGVGKCRRESSEGEHDVMCPSYMVTRDEKHTTRGRAHLVWEMLRAGAPVANGFDDEGVREALHLCLACKGCKSDCPVSVDVATLKAEFFAHYYEHHARPRHAYAFGLIDRWARLAELAPGVANLATQLPGLSAIAKLAANVSLDARIPAFAPETFRRSYARRSGSHAGPGPRERVILFPDTFNDHFHPGTLMAATEVLEATGREVALPRRRMCCGRPLYDVGMLDRAKAYLEDVLEGLRDEIASGLPIVVLEPSCASVFRDELVDLLPEREDAKRLADRTMLLSELLARDAEGAVPVPHARPLSGRRAIVQGHCHHKSVLGWDSELEVLRRSGLEIEVLDSGCCGMAGAYGFVDETRPVGHAAGERVLLPRVRAERGDTIVIANGFSCRQQIAQHTDRRALHLAEVLLLAQEGAPSPPPGEVVEGAIVRRSQRAIRASMSRAALALAALGAVLALGFSTVRRRTSRRARRRRWFDVLTK